MSAAGASPKGLDEEAQDVLAVGVDTHKASLAACAIGGVLGGEIDLQHLIDNLRRR